MFGFGLAELDGMDCDDLEFWAMQGQRIAERMNAP